MKAAHEILALPQNGRVGFQVRHQQPRRQCQADNKSYHRRRNGPEQALALYLDQKNDHRWQNAENHDVRHKPEGDQMFRFSDRCDHHILDHVPVDNHAQAVHVVRSDRTENDYERKERPYHPREPEQA